MDGETVSRIRYTIKEVASALEEAESTLRYWEGEFPDIISPHRNGRGVRSYSEKDMDDVRLIKYLIRDCGLTLEGVRRRLKNNRESALKHAKVVAYLKNIRTELKSIQKALDEAGKKLTQ
ncbi:MAG: MerR family transcriptional regulator [Tannerella sp.]|jgi:DNA-binding transcriptional MerR regulator|nr:MerR family transcriptional regulator [Tannerella sp.]